MAITSDTQNAQAVQDTQDAANVPVSGIPSATNAGQPQNTPAAVPSPAQPQQPAQTPGLFDKVLQTLAGHPLKDAHIDPDTGKTVGTPVTSRVSLANHVVAAAITGMLKGMAAPPGPGHVAQAGEAGFQGVQQQQDRSRGLMEQEYERQQQAQVHKYQIAHLNAETMANTASAQRAGIESLKMIADANQDHIQQLADQGAVDTDETGKAKLMTYQDIQDAMKRGEIDSGSQVGLQGGYTLVNGKAVATFAIVRNPNAPVTLTQEHADWLKSQGVSVPQAAIGQKIPSKSLSTYDNQAFTHTTGDALLSELKKEAGDDKGLLAKIPTSLDPQTPGLGAALRQYQRALQGAKGGNLYDAIEILNQHNPQAAQTILAAVGGGNAMAGTNLLKAANIKAQQDIETRTAQAKADAEAKTRKPYIEDERQFQEHLVREQHELEKGAADERARGLKADEMATKEANDRDADLQSIDGVRQQLNMATKGNEQAYQNAVTRFAEHEIKAGGMNRFNMAELEMLVPKVGSWGRQLETYANKGFTGKGAAPTVNEMQAILDLESKQRDSLYNSHLQNIDRFIRKGQAPTQQQSTINVTHVFDPNTGTVTPVGNH